MLNNQQVKSLASLTWQEAEKLLSTASIVIVPIGAGCKEHGLHLPLNTDYLLAEFLVTEVCQHTGLPRMPTVSYGYYPAFVEYPGSINISQAAFCETLCDIARSLHRHGSMKIYFLNTGISTNWALEPARQKLATEGIVMEYTDLSTLVSDVESRIATQSRGTHADEIETSMMLYIAPQVVKMALAKRDDSECRESGKLTRDPTAQSGIYSPTGAWGDPTRATREKGQVVTEAVIERIVNFLAEFGRENFVPLAARERYLT